MIRRRSFSSFLRGGDGSTSVEFVVVFLGFLASFLFVVEVALYLFFLASLEKAAEAGVRAAVVSAPVVNIRDENRPTGSGVAMGTRCSSSTCEAWPSEPGCGGQGQSNCSGSTFARIRNHMQGFNGQIESDNIAISYRDTGIGFAGGPSVPMVTVTVSCVPFDTGILGLLLDTIDTSAPGTWDCRNRLGFLPPRSASMTAEDLAR
jgi:hypothetical protein